MKIGPKFKIARRLGAPVFEKTQTPKFNLFLAKKANTRKDRKHPSQVTDFGRQVIEKQKARYSYLLTEKQFSNYVKSALKNQGKEKTDYLFGLLESRLDSVVFRTGFASTKSAARQMVSHGHITVNGKRVTIPSYKTRVGEKIGIRKQSRDKGIFKNLEEKIKDFKTPTWMKFDNEKKEAELISNPSLKKVDNSLFDLGSVLEFYSR